MRIIATRAGTVGLVLASAALAQDAPSVNGTVEAVDAAGGKIAIHHEAIPNLGMDGDMTMIFAVRDEAMLGRVRPGEKVRFTAERVDGRITLTRIEAAR